MDRYNAVIDALQKGEHRYNSRLNAEKTCLHLEYGALEFGGVKFDRDDFHENEEAFNDFFDTVNLYCDLKELYIVHDGMYQISSRISEFENLDVLSIEGTRIFTIDLKRIPKGVKRFTIIPNCSEYKNVMWDLRHLPESIEYLKIPGCEDEHDWPVLKYFENLTEIDLSHDHHCHYKYDDDGNDVDYEADVLTPWLKKYKSWQFDADRSLVHILPELT